MKVSLSFSIANKCFTTVSTICEKLMICKGPYKTSKITLNNTAIELFMKSKKRYNSNKRTEIPIVVVNSIINS